MRFRTYILLAATVLWFIFGSLFLYRSFWGLEDIKSYKNSVEHFGVTELKPGQNNFAFTFKLKGKVRVFGVFKKKEVNYTEFVNAFKIGDTVTVHYGDWKLQPDEVNTQIYNLKIGQTTLINNEDRIAKDRKIAGILLLISACLGGLTFYVSRKKPKEQTINL